MKRICSHHIGGRSGNRAFPFLAKFEKDLVNVLYDADQDCIAQVENRNKALGSELHVLPYCVGGEHVDEITFNINYDPSGSSLMDMNEEYASWYFYFRKYQYDCIIKETFKTMEKRTLQVVTLDEILANNPAIMPPDILSLDTQGTEYEILQGAQNALNSNALAVIAEVEFHPIYKGQKLFGDVCSLLAEQGFQFVRFIKYFLEYSPFRWPVGLRGEGFQNSTDALFFKKLDNIENIEDLCRRQTMLDKLAFISIVFNQFEYALECIHKSRECQEFPDFNEIDKEKCSYIKLLREIEMEAKKHNRFPPTFAQKYSFEQSKARFDVESDFGCQDRKDTVDCDNYDQIKLEEYDDSEVEKILRKYELQKQADVIKKMRIGQMRALEG